MRKDAHLVEAPSKQTSALSNFQAFRAMLRRTDGFQQVAELAMPLAYARVP